MRNDKYRTFRFDSSFDRPERPEIWKQVRPRCDGRWCASSFTHRGSSLQWHLVPRAACHICERKWPGSLCQPDKDCYGRKGANLQLHCDVAREALSPAIIRNPEPGKRYGMSARCALVSYRMPASAYVSTATRVFVIHDLYTVTKFDRAKTNAVSISFPMCCHSVGYGTPSPNAFDFVIKKLPPHTRTV